MRPVGLFPSSARESPSTNSLNCVSETLQTRQVGDEGGELLPFSAGSRAICVERDAESDANLHEKVVVEQFKLLQTLFSTNLKQALISELVGSLVAS